MRVNQSPTSPVQGNEVAAKNGPRTQEGKRAERAEASEKVSGEGRTQATQSTKKQAHGEKAEISPKAKEFAQAKAAATEAPDVREDKIAEIKKRLAEGRYKVDVDAVADRLVNEHIKTSGLQ